MPNESGENLLVGKIVFPYLFRCLDLSRFSTCFVQKCSPVETSFRAVLNVTQSSHLIHTNYKFILNSCFIQELIQTNLMPRVADLWGRGGGGRRRRGGGGPVRIFRRRQKLEEGAKNGTE